MQLVVQVDTARIDRLAGLVRDVPTPADTAATLAAARSRAPVRTGTYRSSIRAETGRGLQAITAGGHITYARTLEARRGILNHATRDHLDRTAATIARRLNQG